ARRAAPLGVIAAAVIALAVSTLTAIERGRQAQRRFDQLRGLAHYLLFDVYDSMVRFPGSLPARRDVAERARQYLERSAPGLERDDVLAREVAEAYLRLGDVLGGPYLANLGDTRGALESYRKGAALMERLAHKRASDAIYRLLTEAHLNIARILLRQFQCDAAGVEIERAMSIARGLRGRNPANASDAELLARAYMYLGEKQSQVATRHNSVSGLEEAWSTYRTAVSIQESTAAPRDAFWTATLGSKYFHVSYPMLTLGNVT